MVVGSLELELEIPGAFNLKEKRRVLRSLLERARRDLHVAAAEVDDHDLWNSAVVGIACVSNGPAHAESVLQGVIDLFDAAPDVSVIAADKAISRS